MRPMADQRSNREPRSALRQITALSAPIRCVRVIKSTDGRPTNEDSGYRAPWLYWFCDGAHVAAVARRGSRLNLDRTSFSTWKRWRSSATRRLRRSCAWPSRRSWVARKASGSRAPNRSWPKTCGRRGNASDKPTGNQTASSFSRSPHGVLLGISSFSRPVCAGGTDNKLRLSGNSCATGGRTRTPVHAADGTGVSKSHPWHTNLA